jgi:gas vesicle protein
MASFGSFFTGLLAGAAIGMLYAPKKGSEIRNVLSRPFRKAQDLYEEFEDEFSSSSGKTEKSKSSSSKTDRSGYSGKSKSEKSGFSGMEKESGSSYSEKIKRDNSGFTK